MQGGAVTSASIHTTLQHSDTGRHRLLYKSPALVAQQSHLQGARHPHDPLRCREISTGRHKHRHKRGKRDTRATRVETGNTAARLSHGKRRAKYGAKYEAQTGAERHAQTNIRDGAVRCRAVRGPCTVHCALCTGAEQSGGTVVRCVLGRDRDRQTAHNRSWVESGVEAVMEACKRSGSVPREK